MILINIKNETSSYVVNDTKVTNEESSNNVNSLYNECLLEDNYEPDLESEKEDLNAYASEFPISIYYEELEANNSYSYDENKVYYGASLIKIVDALYLIDNKIDLNTNIKLSKTAKSISSTCLSDYSAGSEVSLNTLMTCALSVSDNGAHYDLIRYIGVDNLDNYAESLGANLTINEGDYYGNQTVINTNIFLKRLWEVLPNNQYLIPIMANDYSGYLNTEDTINVLHKFGYYGGYYHDIGLVNTTYPYTISVLTELGYDDEYGTVINTVANKIKNIHNLYWQGKEDYCYEKTYNE